MMNHLWTSPHRLLLCAFVAALMCLWMAPAATADEAASTTTTTGDYWVELDTGADPVDAPPSPYAELVRNVGPAVVNLIISYDDELPDHARRSMPGPRGLAEGSGFVIHPDGYLLTNFHVIDRAGKVSVKFDDGQELDAQVVGGDPITDIALLKLDTDRQLATVPLGDSSAVDVGDYVVAIGNPLGLSHSVTAGIVSALDRRDLPIEGQDHQGNFIQIDAPINPGNSGGPLLNMSGEVIGINTAINRQGQGISFAIPVNLIKTLLPQLHERGYVIRSWLGVRIQPLDPLLARSFGFDHHRGALVTEVIDDSPAAQAGIRERDIIVSMNEKIIADSDALPLMVSTTPQDAEVLLSIFRDGEYMQVQVELESLPDQSPPDLPGTSTPSQHSDQPAGVEVTSMTERLSRQLRVPDDAGVVVKSLSDTSPARHAGLRNRDVIIQVGPRTVDSEQEFREAIQSASGNGVIRLKVLRNGRPVYMAFTH